MEVLDASRCADDGEAEGLGDIGCRGTIGVCGLDYTNPEVGQPNGLDKVCDEGSSKGGNLVSIKQAEYAVGIIEVINNSISIAVE